MLIIDCDDIEQLITDAEAAGFGKASVRLTRINDVLTIGVTGSDEDGRPTSLGGLAVSVPDPVRQLAEGIKAKAARRGPLAVIPDADVVETKPEKI